MKKFKVTYTEHSYMTEVIEAEDEDDALEKFNQMAEEGKIKYERMTIDDSQTDVEEIKEE